jgi:hypothetical protein
MPQAAFGIFFLSTGGFWNYIIRAIRGFVNAATSSLKRVTEMIFRISKCFHCSMRKLQIWISLQLISHKNLKAFRAHPENTDVTLRL